MSESLVAIVTGGAQGLGAAIAIALLKTGYKVCVADIQKEKGRQFVKEQQEVFGNENVIFSLCDVTKEADYKEARPGLLFRRCRSVSLHDRIFDLTLKEFERLDLVVNNAGIINELNVKKTVDINLMGPIVGCQLAFQYMGKSHGGKGGMVINTASILGFVPYHALPLYTATKHGVLGLTRSYGLLYHLERDGIIFAALCPSFTDTDILDNVSTHSLEPGVDPRKTEVLMSTEYVAGGVLKLLEDRINGSALLVTHTGGYQYIGFQEEFKDLPIG